MAQIGNERSAAGDHLVSDYAQRVDICCSSRLAQDLFRRHIAHASRKNRRLCLIVERFFDGREAEVDYLDRLTFTRRLNHYVLGLQITVIDALIVGGADGVSNLPDHSSDASKVSHPF